MDVVRLGLIRIFVLPKLILHLATYVRLLLPLGGIVAYTDWSTILEFPAEILPALLIFVSAVEKQYRTTARQLQKFEKMDIALAGS